MNRPFIKTPDYTQENSKAFSGKVSNFCYHETYSLFKKNKNVSPFLLNNYALQIYPYVIEKTMS